MTTCIRRPHSTWTSCNCDPCRADRLRMRKLHQAGLGPGRASSPTAWAVLDRMIAADWTIDAIASACELPVNSVAAIIREHNRGHRRTIGAGIAARIIHHGAPTAGAIGVVGSRRKLQALARIGHTVKMMSTISGIGASTLTNIQRGRTGRIKIRVADGIDRTWQQLSARPGPSERVRQNAIEDGWAPPLAWDDIDDPTAIPQGVRRGAA